MPLDQSPAAEVCVPLVASIARGSGATLRPLRVAPVMLVRPGRLGL